MSARLMVAYTGRDELGCREILKQLPVTLVPVPITAPVDLGISAAGSHIFTADEIALARLGIVNLHMAPLPEYRGRFSATHAILNGERRYGATVHYIDEGIDTGPIIAQCRFPILPDDSAGSLRARALQFGRELFLNALPLLIEAALRGERLPSWPQNESRARYYDKHSLPDPVPGDPLMERALMC